jgi:hypothetical protein
LRIGDFRFTADVLGLRGFGSNVPFHRGTFFFLNEDASSSAVREWHGSFRRSEILPTMKKSHSHEHIVPPQHEGTKKDIEHTIKAADENDAKTLFMIGRNRLMSVNHWHEYAQPITATFRLSDEQGKELKRTAEVGDYFKIDVPAPGPTESNGIDWVRIEAIEDRSDPNGNDELIAIRVRPAPDPTSANDDVAHFFKDSATSSFVIERHGRTVSAGVYGRNEKPNTETNNIIDKVRNAIVGTTAILGFSNVQWKNLAKGLIETEG